MPGFLSYQHAVVRAILLDVEARRGHELDPATFGKLREPLVRLAGLWRVFDAQAASGIIRYSAPEVNLGQAALRSPSVFNFFYPNFVPDGPVGASALVAPEFQIMTHSTITSLSNELRWRIYNAIPGASGDSEHTMMLTVGGAAAASFQALSHAAALRAATANSGDYRALVVLYLAGGNDSYNMLVPTNGQDFADYLIARQNLAVPLNELIPIQPSTSDGRTYGLHPALAPLEPLFSSNRLAIVRNVGNLARPVTRAQYLAKTVALPPRLFSHNDQQAQSMRTAVDVETSLGWGGAVADELASLNGVTDLSPSITLAGATPLLSGAATHAYSLGTSGAVALSGFGGSTGAALRSTFDQLRGQARQSVIQQQFSKVRAESIELNALIESALAVSPDVATPFSATSSTARQLRMIARTVAARAALGARRQVFFARSGGWDTHDAQLASHPSLLADLAASLASFQEAMVEVGCEEQVTTVVISEFGRTLTSNGKGTDHGWGGHFLALGGAVRGGDFYGTMPSLALDGPDDAGRGRMIPTTATDQFAATLAEWLGIPRGQLTSLFPNLVNFAAPTLDFMA